MDSSNTTPVGTCQLCETRKAQGSVVFRGHRLDVCAICAGAIGLGGYAAQLIRSGLQKMRARREREKAAKAASPTHEHAFKLVDGQLVCACGHTFQGAP